MVNKGGEDDEEIDKNIDLSVYDGIDPGGYRENQNYNLIREVRYRLGLMGRGMPMSGVPFFFFRTLSNSMGKEEGYKGACEKIIEKGMMI